MIFFEIVHGRFSTTDAEPDAEDSRVVHVDAHAQRRGDVDAIREATTAACRVCRQACLCKRRFICRPSMRSGLVGSYRLIEKLGEGGMGTVFLAEDINLKRRVALKVMKPHVAAEQISRERFLREARAAAALDHDNIVAIHGIGEDNGIPYLAMPLLKGQTLGTLLDRGGRAPDLSDRSEDWPRRGARAGGGACPRARSSRHQARKHLD